MQVGRGSLHGDFWWRRKELYCGMLGTVVLGRCCLSSYLFTKVRRGVWRVRAECWMVRLDDQDRLRVSCHILKNAGVDGASFAGHAEILPALLFLSVIWVLSACENCSFKGPSHWECNALSSVFFLSPHFMYHACRIALLEALKNKTWQNRNICHSCCESHKVKEGYRRYPPPWHNGTGHSKV